MEVAKIKITGTDAVASDLKKITSGMIGATVSIEYDDTWEGLNKQVVFKSLERIFNAEGTTIPTEVLQIPGFELKVGVYGYSGDGSIAIPTVWASLGMIQPGADPEGDEAARPTLPIWARMQNQIGNLNALKTKAKESLVAAINELQAAGVDKEEIQRIIGEYLKENEVGGKSDLAVNDPNAAGYVANRTHWKEEAQIPLDIQWDGVIGDRYVADLYEGSHLVKVSDLTMSDEEFAQCKIYVVTPEETIQSDITILPLSDLGLALDGVVDASLLVWVFRETGDVQFDEGVTFSVTPGIYLAYAPDTGVYVSCLYSDTVTVPGTVYHPLPPEYLKELPKHEHEIPLFDLAAMGLPDTSEDSGPARLECDTKQIMTAISRGAVKVSYLVSGTTYTSIIHGTVNADVTLGYFSVNIGQEMLWFVILPGGIACIVN